MSYKGIKNKVMAIFFIFLFSMIFFQFKEYKVVLASEKTICINEVQYKSREYVNENFYDNVKDEVGEKYYKSDRIVQILKIIMSFLVPLLILFTGFSKKLSIFSNNIGKNLFFTVGIYIILYTLIDSALNFPINFYASFVQSHIFGFSHESFVNWIKNYSIDIILTLLGLILVLWIPYRFIKKHPKRWWVYTSIISIPIILFMYLAQPILIDPLFNKFKNVSNKTLERNLIKLTKKANIQNCTILQIDKSKETNMINAYMTGIGKSKRIVLWDTAIKKLNLKELEFVMAHEIGHYVLSHTKKLVLINIIGVFFVFYIVSRIGPYILKKYKDRFKVHEFKDIASYPIIILVINFCFIFIVPAMNAYSCYIEHEADIFAIEITKDNSSAISAFYKLSNNGISIKNPDIFYKMWKYDHPPIEKRIEFFKRYKPWENGEKLRYEEYINTEEQIINKK